MLLSMPRRSRRLARRTILPNGDYEVDAASWTAGASTSIARTTAEHAYGAAALVVTATAALNNHQVLKDTTQTIFGATAGRVYRVEFWVKGEGGSIGKTYGMQLVGDGGGMGSENLTTKQYVMTADWQYIIHRGTAVVQNDRTSIRPNHFSILTPGSGDVYYLDGIRVVRVH